jgi:hypothetical protein
MKIKRNQDAKGMVFGNLTVLGRTSAPNSTDARYFWMCLCDCGAKKKVATGDLNSGNVSSCGCAREDNHAPIKHGLSDTPEYSAYKDMVGRCTNPKIKTYRLYGGRGITVCKRWLGSIEAFYKDMGPRPGPGPGPGYELDRENNDKGYSKSNCRWVTHKKNSDNRQNSIRVRCKGRTRSISEWAEEIGVTYESLYRRYKRNAEATINYIKEVL